MRYRITVEREYLRADLFNRETAQETREFLVAVGTEARKHRRRQVLIVVHASRTIFKVEQYGVFDYFAELGGMSNYRIALTADSDELRFAQQYIESLARQHGINVRSFRTEQAALNWFSDRRWLPERRLRQEPYGGPERRQEGRRGGPRSIPSG